MMTKTLKYSKIQKNSAKYHLINYLKEELIESIKELVNKLSLKFISSKEVIMEVSSIYDKENFIRRVEVYCKECEDEQYHIESEYYDYLEEWFYEEDEIKECGNNELSEEFEELLEIFEMFGRNYDDLHSTFETLIENLYEVGFNKEAFAIDNPRDYVDIDWY